MDLGAFTDEKLFDFFCQNKTKISTIEKPLMFLRLLKDNRLITKEHFQTLESNADDDSLYAMLECVENCGKKEVRKFWQCVDQDHILQRYLQLSEITKTLKNVLPKPEESSKIKESSEDCNTEGKREVKRMRTEINSLNNQAGPSSQSTNSQMKTSEHVEREARTVTPINAMDLGAFTDEKLFDFFCQNKTKISTIEKPLMFLRLLKDNRLITKEHFQTLEKNADDDSLYAMLECVENSGQKEVRKFWQCVDQDHILQRYLQLSEITKTLKNVPKPEESSKIKESSEDCNTEGKREVKRMRTEINSLNNQAGPSSQSTNSQMKTSEHAERVSPAPQCNYLEKNNETKVKSSEQEVGKEREVKNTESNSVNNQAGASSQIINIQMKTSEDVEKVSPAPPPQRNSLEKKYETKVKSAEQDVGKEQEVKKMRTENSSVNNQSGLSLQITNSQMKTSEHVEKDSSAPQNHSVRKKNVTKEKSKEQDVGKEHEVKKMRTKSSSMNNQSGLSLQITNSQMKTSEHVEKDSPAPQNHSVRKKNVTKVKSTEQDVRKEQEVNKMRTESSSMNNQAGPSSQSTNSQMKTSEHVEKASPVKKGDKQQIWKGLIHKTQLPITCGNKEGTFFWDNMPRGKCIWSNGCWFTPTGFEKFGGMEKWKSWKFSIRYGKTPLKKLIEERHRQCSLMKTRTRTRVQKNMNERFPISSNKRSNADFGWVEESDAEDFQEQEGRGGGTEFRGRVDEEEEEDMADLSVFQAPSLPVTCVSLTGTLYKYRFGSGISRKCIRTEERWFTPEEFVKQQPTLTNGHWKKDILCHGKTLKFLLQKGILCVHSLQCECEECSIQEKDVMAQNNDDECYVCHFVGDLVCCDGCPRAFHSHCHLPAVYGDSSGKWICTFCVLRNSQQWRDSSNMSEQEAFNAPVSQYRLHCHYLLLFVYREDIQKVFVEDPRKIVRRYSEFISQPMWLDRIKQKLESGEYQTVGAFVSDFQLIFRNCSTFNGDSEFSRISARLKQMFNEEFQKIFSIQ